MTETIKPEFYPGAGSDEKHGSEFVDHVSEAALFELPDITSIIPGAKIAASPDVAATAPICIRQVKQAALVQGLERVFADIYGVRSETPITLGFLLRRLHIDELVIRALELTEGQPLANKFLDRLAHRLALTAEGQKQFLILKLLYGLHGDKPRTFSEIAALAGMTLKDVKHLSIMMRCRLESEQIRSFTEETIKLLAREFAQSALFKEILLYQAAENKGLDPVSRYQPPALTDIKGLEEMADNLVANLENSPTINISGQAGTGKTSLALKVTRRLLEQGKRVLYVCHSRFFAQHVQEVTRFFPGDLTVSTFHALCHLYAKEADIKMPTYRNNKVFNELFPELLIAAVHAQKDTTFDAIIVDEGHSLLPNFWRALKFCLKDLHRGAFFYFYDPVILEMAKNKAAPFATSNIDLSRALRPNYRLAETAGGLEAYEAISKEEMSLAVSKVVADLLQNGIKPHEIAILNADAVQKISDNRFALPKGIKLAATPGNRERHIVSTSLASFRALTKRMVILTMGREVEDLADWKLKYLSYAAFSRAEEKLILIGNLKAIEKVLPDGAKILNAEQFEPQLRRP